MKRWIRKSVFILLQKDLANIVREDVYTLLLLHFVTVLMLLLIVTVLLDLCVNFACLLDITDLFIAKKTLQFF
jgi:hypothetical protein